MNKESVKVRILKQFRSSDSPIHLIISNTSPTKDRFRKEKTFGISDLDLYFNVETIDDELGIFQVQFIDKPAPKNRIFHSLEGEITYLLPAALRQIYSREEMRLEGDYLVFEIVYVGVISYNFEFKFQNDPPETTLRLYLNLSNMKFSSEEDVISDNEDVAKNFLLSAEKVLKRSGSRIRRQAISSATLNDIAERMEELGASSLKQMLVAQCWENITYGPSGGLTQMIGLVRNLYENLSVNDD